MRMKTKAIAMALSLAMVGSMIGGVDVSAKSSKKYKTETKWVSTKEVSYVADFDGKLRLESDKESKYDKFGNCVYLLFYAIDSNGNKLGYTTYQEKYDSRNRIKWAKSCSGKVCESVDKYTYKKNKRIHKSYYDGKKKFTDKSVTTYKKNKATAVYYENGKKTGTSVETFDKNGNSIKEVYKNNKKIDSIETRKYKKNVLIKEVFKNYNENGKLSHTMEKNYNKNGKFVSLIVTNYSDGKVFSKKTDKFRYEGKDIYQTAIETSSYTKDVRRNELKYRYDKAYNLINLWQKSYVNDELKNTITYQNEFYTSGEAKGCLKKSTSYQDGELVDVWMYTVKKIKVKVLKKK
ncbi:MAG: hypothetical protein K6G64_01190 [Eubacterium sp.]|nr:hypothetical protein [Eubacterium sp.]